MSGAVLIFCPNSQSGPDVGGRFCLSDLEGRIVWVDHGTWTTRRAAWKAAKSLVKRLWPGCILKGAATGSPCR